MSRKLMRTLAAGLLAALLTACGAEQGGGGAAQIDGSKVDVILTSAEPAAAGEETTLIAELTGAVFPEELTFVQFDVREADGPVLINGELQGEQRYTAQHRFEEPGVYDVVLHIYVEDLHLMKRKQVEVQ